MSCATTAGSRALAYPLRKIILSIATYSGLNPLLPLNLRVLNALAQLVMAGLQ